MCYKCFQALHNRHLDIHPSFLSGSTSQTSIGKQSSNIGQWSQLEEKTGKSRGSEVPTIFRAQRGGNCTKREAQKSAQAFPELLNYNLHMQGWIPQDLVENHYELAGESGVDKMAGDTV